jgi:hypothetical protein
MTGSGFPDALETLALPAGAIELESWSDGGSRRELAVMALQQALRERRLPLPLGPALGVLEPERLLSLNRIGVQLVCGGLSSDQLTLPVGRWHEAGVLPQLVLAALVDEEAGVVLFPGVLTSAELEARAQQAGGGSGGELALDVEAWSGGLDRLLVLVQLLEPEALPALAWGSDALRTATAAVVSVVDWLRGQLDAGLQGLGGQLVPVTAGVFRSAPVTVDESQSALAMVVLPFGLAGEQLVSGDAAARCVRRFQLSLIATGQEQPTGLVLRLSSAVPGALLPDGLQLEGRQGGHTQTIVSAGDTDLELNFRGGGLLSMSLRYGAGDVLQLPALQLPL